MTAQDRMLLKELIFIARRCLELETNGRFMQQIERALQRAEMAVR